MSDMPWKDPNFESTQTSALEQKDIEPLTPVLETWIRDRTTGTILDEEISEVKQRMYGSIEESNGYKFFVIRNDKGEPVGVVGCRTPDEMTSLAATTPKPIEVVNFFVSPDMKGRGLGTKLLEEVKISAVANDNTEILINSGPRYRNSAWGFYTRKLGAPIGLIRNAYNGNDTAQKSFDLGAQINEVLEENGDAPVWRVLL